MRRDLVTLVLATALTALGSSCGTSKSSDASSGGSTATSTACGSSDGSTVATVGSGIVISDKTSSGFTMAWGTAYDPTGSALSYEVVEGLGNGDINTVQEAEATAQSRGATWQSALCSSRTARETWAQYPVVTVSLP